MIKRIAAREVVIIIAIAVFGFLVAFISDYLFQHNKVYIKWMGPALYSYEPLSLNLLWHRALLLFNYYKFPSLYSKAFPYRDIQWFLWTEHLGEFIFLYGYLICLPIRFIIRAAKTLKEK